MNTLITITLALILLLLSVFTIAITVCLKDSFKTIDRLHEELMNERQRNAHHGAVEFYKEFTDLCSATDSRPKDTRITFARQNEEETLIQTKQNG